VDLLQTTVQHYDWGSVTAIPELLGVEPDGRPWAELWIGAHPMGPSAVDRPGGPVRLDVLIDGDRATNLGAAATTHGRLPYLVKILAAAAPLSLQTHPSAAQAVAGFEREERSGVDRTASNRVYRDPNHKPELICALTPFTALCGFRAPAESARLLTSFDVPELTPVIERLANADGADVRPALEWLLRLPSATAAQIARSVVAAAGAQRSTELQREHEWVLRIAEHHPDDVGVVTAMLLNLVELQPGEGLFLEASTLHAYLEGTGVEVMASSDNVIRGGLTTKHIDVDELLAVVRTTAEEIAVVTPRSDAGELVFDTPAAEFRLSVLQLEGDLDRDAVERVATGPEILLCTDGRASVRAGDDEVILGPGAACFVPGATGRYRVTGTGRVHRTTVG
jgi:mannose-6-phosphate isomerase